MTPDGKTLYVASENNLSVTVISTTTNTVVRTRSGNSIPLGVGHFPVAIVMTSVS